MGETNKTTTKKTKQPGIKGLVFAIVLILLATACTSFYCMVQLNKSTLLNTAEPRHVTASIPINKFYLQDKNSLDGVYLGSSAANRYWMAPRAYETQGLCIYNMGTWTQPFVATKYLIKEAIKRNPDMDIVIIELRCVVRDADVLTTDSLTLITDMMPFSRNRNDLIDAFLDYCREIGVDIDYNANDYYYPLLRDSNFSWLREVNSENLKLLHEKEDSGLPGVYKGYPISGRPFNVDPLPAPEERTETAPLEKADEAVLRDLFDYCKSIDAKVVFVSAPYGFMTHENELQLQYAVELCESEGFTVLDFNCEPLRSDIAMNWDTDFYDHKHTNVVGARRYTDYLAEYLVNHYKLEDHRGDPDFESWQHSSDTLNEYIRTYPSN